MAQEQSYESERLTLTSVEAKVSDSYFRTSLMVHFVDHPAHLAPLERVSVPSLLDGSRGSNRSTASRQISADNDVDAIKAWLARFLDKKTTFDNYRKEAERLLLWSTIQMENPCPRSRMRTGSCIRLSCSIRSRASAG